MSEDEKTAEAFANSWTHLPMGSVYTREQFEEWLAPITATNVEGRSVLELGCGNASLLVHLVSWKPSQITGVELGSAISTAETNMRATGFANYSLIQADLTSFSKDGFDLVYCIGVLHHLKDPVKGFESVLANTRTGGRFHCWVYAREGNTLVVGLIDPIRKITARFPWWLTKYLIATPLAFPFFIYAKLLRTFRNVAWVRKAPLFQYCLWISQRSFSFFRHVAFDQLVAPRTCYITKATVDSWMSNPKVVPESSYIVFRNGNSWKFGGIVR